MLVRSWGTGNVCYDLRRRSRWTKDACGEPGKASSPRYPRVASTRPPLAWRLTETGSSDPLRSQGTEKTYTRKSDGGVLQQEPRQAQCLRGSDKGDDEYRRFLT